MRWLVWSMKSNWPYAAVRDKQVGWVETDGLLVVKASPKVCQFHRLASAAHPQRQP